ncbi:MAG TPA: TonB-dependent receptor plug domain-containing protein [Flavisolibacter sp.]|nr:TonB-dependent receptor plug domain-containing protein [Flavisolibacter sp.]
MTQHIQRYLLLLSLMLPLAVPAQTGAYEQDKEKVYVHTNHVFFSPGEILYFKCYVVNARTQRPSRQSSVVHAEVLGPSGNTIEKLSYPVNDGYAEGSFTFREETPGGIYKLKVYTNWMRNEKDSSFFVKELTLQKFLVPRILMKLDFPEKGYGAGQEVKAQFSMRNLADQPIRNYAGKFTVSLGGQKAQTGSFTTDAEGKALIRFSLPASLSTIDGLLNLTIDYDAYTESISRSIPIVLHKIDLQFLPEGGSFVQGLPTTIAFKAVNEYGKATDVKGEIIDSKGAIVAGFATYHFGMGKFAFVPQQNMHYRARITSPAGVRQIYDLPLARPEGAVMNISKTDGKIRIRIASTAERELKLEARFRGELLYTEQLRLQAGKKELELDEKAFPAGINCFTLYANGLPQAERIVFMNQDDQLNITIRPDKTRYQPREKVKLTITTRDKQGKPMPSNLSLSVVDDKLWTMADDKQDHILSWLLVSTELRGKVEEPQFYFRKEESKALPTLDLVMMTHGYRYFDYRSEIVDKQKLLFLPDQLNMLSGVVLGRAKKPVPSTIFLVPNLAGGKAMKMTTGPDGLFFFSGLQHNTRYHLFAQALGGEKAASIEILQKGIGYNPLAVTKGSADETIARSTNLKAADEKALLPKTTVAKPLENKDRALATPPAKPDLNANANLQEVVVTSYSAGKRIQYVGASARVWPDDLRPVNNSFMALQGKIPGLSVTQMGQPGMASSVSIRGQRTTANNNPLFVLNGIPMENINFNNLDPQDINNITVLKDATAIALYGSRAANGAILIELKKYYSENIQLNLGKKPRYISQVVWAEPSYFSPVKRFYAPTYHSPEADERNDFRETIYWNPVVQTDKEGKAVVEFYNSDASTTFRAIAEGLDYSGMAGRNETTYASSSAMSVDAKIPPYLTVGDKALIPLVIRNNHEQNLDISIAIDLPGHMKSGAFERQLRIPPDSAREVAIPLEAQAGLREKIIFRVRSQFGEERLVLPVVAAEKGFPVIATFSGNKSQSHRFDIGKAIEGSLRAELKLFKSLEGQLLDGIASMLREPHGCFEQTSSSTYPNIYVLKYLRETGKANPEIEKLAMGYIEAGYRRLIGFETAQHGFEWFGNTPPHAALTAYGLLEFTDMKSFVRVDEKMLDRTKKFLLDRRDGKGGFLQSSGGYDRFAAVPNKIANIYIVYALTQAGIGSEIGHEYRTAVQKALESNDGYQLAMMALAASNMKHLQDYRSLMEALGINYRKNGLQAETSVVNSREASLKVETLALYALALMREPSPNLGVIAELMSAILSQKTYYGYGATQATVLALQAITEYSKLAGRIAAESEVEFVLNKEPLSKEAQPVRQIREGSNEFSVAYRDDKKTIPYNLEIAYNTLIPPNSEKAELRIGTSLDASKTRVGETVRMEISVSNERDSLQAMAVAKIGIPAGLTVQPWQLKELMEKKQVAYHELFDNYLVFYWMGFAGREIKTVKLDLKAEIAGAYLAKASNTYLYYMPEHKHWNEGLRVEIER